MNEEGLSEEQSLTEQEVRINDIKDFRKTIHHVILSIDKIPIDKITRELSLVKTNADQSRFWLGRLLGALGNESPYKTASDVKVEIVEPMAEIWEGDVKSFDPNNVTEVKNLYNLFGIIGDKVINSCLPLFAIGELSFFIVINAYNSLSLSKMWFGMQLGVIRDSQETVNDVKSNDENVDDLLKKISGRGDN